MGDEPNDATIDLVRWSFTIDPAHRSEIQEYLEDLGLDVLVREGAQFLVTWDEPEGDLDETVEAIWAINEAPFEITQEEFRRDNLVTINHEEDDAPSDQAAA